VRNLDVNNYARLAVILFTGHLRSTIFFIFAALAASTLMFSLSAAGGGGLTWCPVQRRPARCAAVDRGRYHAFVWSGDWGILDSLVRPSGNFFLQAGHMRAYRYNYAKRFPAREVPQCGFRMAKIIRTVSDM